MLSVFCFVGKNGMMEKWNIGRKKVRRNPNIGFAELHFVPVPLFHASKNTIII
jgi:hypothetical protein